MSRKRYLFMFGILALVVITVAAGAVQITPGGSDNSSAANGTWNGDGSQGNPYQIDDVADLRSLSDQVNATPSNSFSGIYFILTNDIDLNIAPYNAGGGWIPIGVRDIFPFRGNFDGDGHTIAGLYFSGSVGYQNYGLFGRMSGSVKDLGVVNININVPYNNYAGGVAGYNNGKIENCYVTGNIVAAQYAGGIAGGSDIALVPGGSSACFVKNCYFSGTISGRNNIGGLLGYNNSPCQNCYSLGAITIVPSAGTLRNGGFIAYNDRYGTVSNCFFLKDGTINDGLDGIGASFDTVTATPMGEDGLLTMSTYTTVPVADGGWDFSSTGPWGMYLNNNDPNSPGYGFPYLKTVNNFILIKPAGGKKVYDGNPAPEPTWTSDNYSDKSLFTGALEYDPSPAIDVGKYDITIGDMLDPYLSSPYYQISFKSNVQYEITSAPPVPKDYTITASSDANSTISPAGQVTAQSGSSKTFTYSAASGYHITSVLINGTALPQDQITGSYTFTNMLYNQSIDVKSAPGAGPSGSGTSVTLTVDIVGGNGTAEYRIGSGQYVTFTGAQIIPIGSNLYVSVIADSGYSFVEWTGDISSKNAEVNFANVTSDIHLTAHLSNDNATGSAGQNGNYGISNLILAVLALIIGIIAIVVGVRKNAEGKASVTAAVAGLFSLIVGIASVIAFYLTEDLSISITATDNWTVWMAVLFVVAVVLAAITFWASGVHKTKGNN